MKTRFLFLSLALIGATAFAGDLPDPVRFPGALNPVVTQETIGKTICVPGWAEKTRPSTSYTTKLKAAQIKQLGLPGTLADYAEDHLVSLSLGGAPRDPRNLWPQRRGEAWGATRKDRLESRLHKLVCAEKVPLATAQHDEATDWITAYKLYVGPK